MAITVSHCELHEGSGVNEFEATSGRAVRVLLCDYEDADTLCSQAMGGMIASGQVIFWNPPAQHPRRNYLYVSKASYEPLGTPGLNGNGLATWTKAKVRLEYSTLDRDQQEDPQSQNQIYIQESQSSASEAVTLKGSGWQWAGDNVPLADTDNAADFQKIIPMTRLSYTINNWITAPITTGTFSDNIGKINSSSFRALWQEFSAKTLLFEAYNASRSWTSDGVTAWTVTLNFIHKPSGWNKFWRQSASAFQEIEVRGGTTNPYEAIAFTELFP